MCLQPTSRCSNVHPSAWMILFAILTPSCYLWLLITILNNFVKRVLQNSHLCRAFNLSMTTTGKKNPHQTPHSPFRQCNMFRWTLSCLITWSSSVALIARISKQKLSRTQAEDTSACEGTPVLTTTQQHPNHYPPDSRALMTGCPQRDG